MVGNFMNAKEAAAFLELTDRRVTGLCNAGEIIGAYKDGSMWYMPEASVRIYKLSHPRRNKKSVEAEAQQAAESMSDAERVIVDAGSDNV